jgi:hypothetical protein
MITPWEEEQILHDVMDGLRAAIHELDMNPDSLTSIKLNKIVYLAVREFDLPITYSWFKYGASLSDTTVEVDYIEPTPLEELPNPDRPSVGHDWEYPTPEEYMYFFTENIDLDHVFQETSKGYLEEFYHGYAPEMFAELYAKSAVLQKSIDDILDMDVEEFNSRRDDITDRLLQELREINIELMMHEDFEDRIVDSFTAYTEILLEIFSRLDENPEDLETGQFSALNRVLKFYYSHAWKYVALDISERTVTGPSRRELLKGAVNELDGLEKNYEEDIQNIRQKCIETGLLDPEPEFDLGIELDDSPTVPDGDFDEVRGAIDRIEERRDSRDYDELDLEGYLRR